MLGPSDAYEDEKGRKPFSTIRSCVGRKETSNGARLLVSVKFIAHANSVGFHISIKRKKPWLPKPH